MLFAFLLMCLLYVGGAFQTSRYLVGQSKYNHWMMVRSRRYPPLTANLEDYEWEDEGVAFFLWFLLSVGCLPLSLMVLAARSTNVGPSTVSVYPKHVRDEIKTSQERRAALDRIKDQNFYIEKLERELQINENN